MVISTLATVSALELLRARGASPLSNPTDNCYVLFHPRPEALVFVNVVVDLNFKNNTATMWPIVVMDEASSNDIDPDR